ncbi:MAG: hypothetical protein ABIM49_05335 [candidate division WOR-3 bacterium]
MKKKAFEFILEEEEKFKKEIEEAEKEKEKIVLNTKKEIEEEREKFLKYIQSKKIEWLSEGISEIEKKCERLRIENEDKIKEIEKIYFKKKEEIIEKILNYIIKKYGD